MLLFTVQGSPRLLQRVHGGCDPVMWHFAYKTKLSAGGEMAAP